VTGPPLPLIVVADDEPCIYDFLCVCLAEWGYRTAWAQDKSRLLELLDIERPCLLLLDLCFGTVSGVKLLDELRVKHPDLVIVMLTGRGSIDTAVNAIRRGVYDFLTKPLNLQRLRVILEHVARKEALDDRLRSLEKLAGVQGPAHDIWGDSAAIERVRHEIACIAPSDATVLILGESGTGKELVARALHELSTRREGVFVPVNTTALPHELAESTLFGHEKGAFTGADHAREGCCELANGGTLFLDEIGEMDPRCQAKLLRFLQERSFQRVGSNKTCKVDVRLVAATNRDLRQAMLQGQFREDLFYRLNVVPIIVPPLRERRDDVPLLATRFLQRAALRQHKKVTGFSADAMSLLTRHDWPGNVRQLEHLIERLVILTRSEEIQASDIPAEIAGTLATGPSASTREKGAARIDDLERQAIADALRQSQGHVGQAARLLGLGRATVYRKIRQYSLAVKEPVPTN